MTKQLLITDRLDPVVVHDFQEVGAVLIRRPGTTEEMFVEFGDAFVDCIRHHATGTPERDTVRAEKYLSTVNKGRDSIPLHREASYLPERPDVLLFYCVRPSLVGGQTTLCDGVSLLKALPGAVRFYVEDGAGAGLVWTWTLPPQRWQAWFDTTSSTRVLERIARLSEKLEPWEYASVEFDDDHLKGIFRTRSVIPTCFGNEVSFCNSVLAYYDRAPGPHVAKHLYGVTLSDGSPFPEDILSTIRILAERLTCEVTWQAGDILMVDNSRWMHGRRPVTDPDRRIFVRLGRYRAP